MPLSLAEPVLKLPVTDQDHVLGPADASLTLLEYGDYQCPHCGKVYPVLEDILARLGDRLRFVYRHFPLAKMHPQARLAAESAEAAGAQGKYWEMHRALFTHQDELDPVHLLQFARSADLDLAKFRHDVETHVFAQHIQSDIAGGARSGVNGTPTFFINGKRYNGLFEREDLDRAIDAAAGTE